uniref:Uncharacterized protein n=1 Tax=Alexandrium monilatum TaxID=311494 RepID=A0A7S4SZ32_9DINO
MQKCVLPEDAFVTVSGWVVVQMAFALLNLCFAPYFQYRVWEKICEESNSEELLQDPEVTVVSVTKEKVQESFKQVFLHDFGVCFYFLALGASFLWSGEGYRWVTAHPESCNPGGGLSFSANVGYAFAIVAVLYTIAWYCCGICARATEIRSGYQEVEQAEQEEQEETKGSP